MTEIKNQNSRIVFFIICTGLLITNFSFFPNNILSWDVFGYYMYLPMIFIYDNWGLQNIDVVHKVIEQYHSSSTLYQAYQTDTGQWIMRYSIGMAYLYSPFFMIGHVIAGFTTYARDGFSYPYQLSILCGGITYSIMGFYFLRKVLLRFNSDAVAAITLLLIYLGTNYLWHAGFQGANAMSHSYLFSLYAALLWTTIRFHETTRNKYLFYTAFVSGLIILARPSEIVCLFIPLLWGINVSFTLKEKWKLLASRWKQLLICVLIMFVIALPQLIYWKIVAGKFLYNSYGDNPGEGFEFLHPYFREVLFSFRKGWLIYTPLMFLAIAGIFYSVRKKIDFSFPVLIYFLTNIFIVSSWSCWWYAESFSQRSLVQSYAVMALPLSAIVGAVSVKSSRVIRTGFYSLLICLVSLNLFQHWQFYKGMIHPSRMTASAYKAIFLKTALPGNFESLLMIDRSAPKTTIDPGSYHKTKEWNESFEEIDDVSQAYASEGKVSMKMDKPDSYTNSIEKKFKEVTDKEHAYIKIKMKFLNLNDSLHVKGSLVASFYHKGFSYGYKSFDIDSINSDGRNWNEVSFVYLTPVIRNPNDVLKIYYWHRDSVPVFVDELSAEIWEPNNQ